MKIKEILIIVIIFIILGVIGSFDYEYNLEVENQELKTALENYNTLMKSIPDDIFLDVIVETDEYDYINYINSKYNLD